MKNIIERIAGGGAKIARYLRKAVSTRLAVAALAALAAGGAWAATDKTNPVTGENQSYTYNYTGSGAWTASDWSPTPSNVPQASGSDVWDSLLIDGNLTVTAPSHVEGWSFRIGLFGDAKLTVPYIRYWNGTAYAVVDEGSKLTIQTINTQDNWAATVNYYVAAAGGVTYECAFNPTVTAAAIYNYNLKGAGSVVYENAVSSGSHVIKQADVTLSGNATPSVESKPLVSFGSGTTKAFTADAAIKVYGTDGTTLVETVNLAEVKTAPTLTADDPVGSCELVQTSTGIVLYYVDGDPSAVVAKTYTPSININFCFGNAPLTTAADVGYSDYAVPGTSWNNMTSTSPASGNGTFTTPLSTVYAVKADGTPSLVSGASVALSGTPGSYRCNSLAAATDLRHGYIDENANNTAPTVTVSGIPYDKYKVIVYTSTDSANSAFGYVSVNGTSYTYVNNELAEGTTAWGASGADNSANAIAEGVNMLVTPTISGATATIVGHKSNGRGCIAAVQIVKVAQQVGENDLLIELDGDETYTFDEAKTYSGTVYVLGEGTVTFAGTASTAETLHIGPAAAVNMVGSALTPATVTGNGTVVYDGAQPATTLGFDNSANWQGTVWVKNVGDTTKGETDAFNAKVTTCLGSNTTDATSNDLNKWGNAASFVKFTNVRGYMAAANVPWMLILEDDSSNYAWYNNEGWTARTITIAGLKGNGTFWDVNNGGTRPFLNFTDASQFTGAIHATGKQVFLSGAGAGNASDLPAGRITVPANQTLTVASGKTWHTRNGLVVDGTLNVNGTLSSDSTTAAVSGSGTVVFAGKMPSPTTDAWWKNAAWTGTVQIKSAAFTGVSGVDTYLDVNKYGNDGSVLELNNCSGWLPVGNTTGDNVCAVPLKVTGTLTINDGYSNRKFTINKLLGNGAIYTTNNGATVTIQVLSADDFTGYVNLNSKRVIFGETVPETFTSGQIYVGEGFTFTVPNSNVAWYGTGGITLAGELKAAALSNFGGGTTITTTDTGVFTLVSNSNTDDMNVDYTRIQGTGTLKFEGSAYRCISTNNFPTAMIVENNLSQGFIHRNAGITVSIGSLSGSGQMRSDWGGSGSTGDRDLRILQAKDTTYSGQFASSNDRIDEVYVAPGASTAGTLTLSGTQTASNGLIVESGAKVNLTGTWVGDTTVSGTFGGTGTLTGNLTFNAGSTFKAFAADEDGLVVSGTVTYPAEGTVTVDVSGLTVSSSGTTLMTFTSAPTAADVASKMVPSSGTFLKLDGSMLKAYPLVATYNDENYATFKEAIDAALADEGGEANLARITVIDGSAELPGGYHISDNTVVKYPVAVVKNGSYLATGYTDTILKALQAIVLADVAGAYDYIEIVSGSSFVIPYGLLGDGVLKIKNTANATPIPDGLADDCITGTNELEGEVYTEYFKSNKPTTYTWVGGVEDALYPGRYMWDEKGNWRYANSSSETVTASRRPQAGDSVVFNTAATVNIAANTTVEAITTSVAITFSKNTSDVNLSATTGIVLTDAAASITVSGVTLSPKPTTTVANSYVKLTDSTYSVQAFVTVTIPSGVEHATATVNGDAVAGGGSVQVDVGSNVTIEWTAASGYKITNGATQTINSIAADTTANSPTVEERAGAAVSGVTFTYGEDYAKARVTATVTGDASSATLTYGGNTYDAQVSNGTATFTDVTVPTRGADIYAPVDYTIDTDAHTTTGGAGKTIAADVYGWITEDKDNYKATGTWETDIAYDGTTATIVDNTYTPTSHPTNDVVTITVNDVVYPDLSDEALILGDAQAAVCLGTNSASTIVFKVLVKDGNDVRWEASTFTANTNRAYDITMIFDYTKGTYSATVDGTALTADGDGATSWGLCKSAKSVTDIEFMGAGSITGIHGVVLEGNMIEDGKGNKYATIQAAIDALTADATLAPLTKLHAGTPPKGWRFDGNTLIKIAKGMFFFAF